MNLTEEKFVTSGELRLWTERSGRPGDPAVLLIMGTSAQGIGWPDDLVDALIAGGWIECQAASTRILRRWPLPQRVIGPCRRRFPVLSSEGTNPT